jgi:HK97 family phage prohead protease
MERRFLLQASELRVQPGEGGERRIVGYAALFNQLSVDLGGFREVIRAGAFTTTLSMNPDVRATLEHEGGLLMLGRTRNGTLRLQEDEVGLRVEIIPPDTQAARDALTLIGRGDLDQMSFAFFTKRDNWVVQGLDYVLRELHEVSLDNGDVSIVTYPAYPATSVQVRAVMNIPEIPADLRVDGLLPGQQARQRELLLGKRMTREGVSEQ